MSKNKTATIPGAAPALCTTHAELAKAVRKDRSTVTRRLKWGACPISEAGPWDADDVATFADWVAEDDGQGGDDLKRAQAVKAKTLTARYLLEMSITLGRVGNAQAEVMMRALAPTTTIHFQRNRYRLGDLLRDRGGMDPHEADAEAEQFAREFYRDWADTFAAMFRHHAAAVDELAPVVSRIRKLADELEVLPDVPVELLAEVRQRLDSVEHPQSKEANHD